MTDAVLDLSDARLVHGAAGLLAAFNLAGVLDGSDVHVALRLGRLAGIADDEVLLAAALAVRAPRLGHVRTDLTTIARTADADVDLPVDIADLPWPDPAAWVAQVATSGLVGPGRPLRLEGSALYLDRYWAEEVQVAADLLARAGDEVATVDTALLAGGLSRLFVGTDEPDLQRVAAATAVLHRLAVIAGGPGTGKTTTVARILALIDEQAAAAGARPPLVALAAPTGKAAARLEEAVHEQARAMPVDDGIRSRLLALHGTTLHRLLGSLPGNHTRFRHNRLNRLPHDVVVIDETSMVSLSHMARLVEAVRPDARLVLVGDPQQLASVEAGAVLGDIVGPPADLLPISSPARSALKAETEPSSGQSDSHEGSIGDRIVVLRRVHRFGEVIGNVADAIRRGDADATVDLLHAGDDEVAWIEVDVSDPVGARSLHTVRAAAVDAGRRVREAAEAGNAKAALAALGGFRLLCAHRRGPAGATTWMGNVERWLTADGTRFAGFGLWYPGRPLLVTANDYSLRLYNGDTGVVIARADGRVVAAFERQGEVVEVSPARLAAVETVYAMTVHKAQGSQFDTVAVLLPNPESPILTRELLYTAVSRARQRVIIVGSEASVRSAVDRPIARASGLRARLWGAG
jgi:exodeoxyribonuclease V alpha subunit